MSEAGDGDKRSVSTDALETLGTIISERERRDAIHIAVEPIQAGERLSRGQDVFIHDGLAYYNRISPNDRCVGIVDPFLDVKTVKQGQWFWLCVYPRQIHSLRHVWTHPDFPDAPEVAGEAPKVHVDKKRESEQWLRAWFETADAPDYDYSMSVISDLLDGIPAPPDPEYGETWRFSEWGDSRYIVFCGQDAHATIPPEFWGHVEAVLGKVVPNEKRLTGFSCTC